MHKTEPIRPEPDHHTPAGPSLSDLFAYEPAPGSAVRPAVASVNAPAPGRRLIAGCGAFNLLVGAVWVLWLIGYALYVRFAYYIDIFRLMYDPQFLNRLYILFPPLLILSGILVISYSENARKSTILMMLGLASAFICVVVLSTSFIFTHTGLGRVNTGLHQIINFQDFIFANWGLWGIFDRWSFYFVLRLMYLSVLAVIPFQAVLIYGAYKNKRAHASHEADSNRDI